MVNEMFIYSPFNHLMQLLAQEYFIESMYLSNHEHVP